MYLRAPCPTSWVSFTLEAQLQGAGGFLSHRDHLAVVSSAQIKTLLGSTMTLMGPGWPLCPCRRFGGSQAVQGRTQVVHAGAPKVTLVVTFLLTPSGLL